MSPTELTCPQCGLVNNYLSEACAQCGIIFVKNPAMQAAQNDPAMPAQAEQDEQRKNAIEAAEAILERSDPAAEKATLKNETITMPDSSEDTGEMMIPVESRTSEIKSEAWSADGMKSEETQKAENPEIEMEAIETTIEMVTEPTDAEELFLSPVHTDPFEKPPDSETVEKSVGPATDVQAAVEQNKKTAKSDPVEPEGKDQKKDDTAVKQSEDEPATDMKPQKDHQDEAPEAAEPIKAQDAATEAAEPEHSEKAKTDSAKPAEKEPFIEENAEPAAADKTLEKALKKQQEIQVREALKKQRETQAKAEALKKENAVQVKAAALKKKKLDQVKAEALKKQKAAQAKAEALKKMKEAQAKAQSVKKLQTAKAEVLKKQKEAQAIAEASAKEIQVARNGVQETVSKTTRENLNTHEKLLGLLKRYKGRAIGINYDNSTEIKEAELVEANEEFFSVMVKDKKLQYIYPLKSILTIIEGQEGVETDPDDKKLIFDAVIKVYPLVAF